MSILFYFIYFLAGTITANGLTHFINGFTGKKFPKKSKTFKSIEKKSETQFVKVMSSPVFNTIWGIINFIIAGLLILKIGNFLLGLNIDSLIYFIGLAIGSIFMSWNFSE